MMRLLASLFAICFSSCAWAQAVPCTGPTQGNCVPTIPYSVLGPLGTLPIAGGSRVELVPVGKLVDTFNSPSTLDTTNNWNTPTQNGTGTATYSQGQEVLSSGTTNGSYALLQSQATFQIKSPALLLWRGAINSQVEIAADCKEMGLFIAAGSPTCAAPVTDGVLFEVTATTTSGNPGGGKLQAVTYAGGARTLIADLSVQNSFTPSFPAIISQDGTNTVLCPARTTPQAFSDTCPHILDIWFNGNSAEFDIDSQPVAFMKLGSLGPNNNLLNWSALTINTGGAAATTIKINQAVLADEARTALSFCDQTYGWRCANVGNTGSLLPLIPQSPIAGNATGTTGAVVGTLAAAAGKFTYLCDFNVSALGTANTVGPVVVAGLAGGSRTYQASTLATGVEYYKSEHFNPCLPSSAVNTAITITTTAAAAGTAVDVNSSGYQQ